MIKMPTRRQIRSRAARRCSALITPPLTRLRLFTLRITEVCRGTHLTKDISSKQFEQKIIFGFGVLVIIFVALRLFLVILVDK